MPYLKLKKSMLIITLLCTCHATFAETSARAFFVVGMESQNYANGLYEHYFQELFSAFAAEHQYEFEFHPLPVNRLYQKLLNKEIDFKFPDHPLWRSVLKGETPIYYSDSTIHYREGLMVLPEKLGRALDRLQVISLPRGFSALAFDQAIEKQKLQVVETITPHAALNMTRLGRSDGTYMNVATAENQLAKMGKAHALTFDPTLPYITDHYYLSSIKHPNVLDQFNRFLREERALIEALQKKYELSHHWD